MTKLSKLVILTFSTDSADNETTSYPTAAEDPVIFPHESALPIHISLS
jgi:hypothetical protein